MDHSGDHSRRSAPRNQPQLRQPLQILPYAYSARPPQHTESAPTGRQVVQRAEPCVFSIHLDETHHRDLRDSSKERWQDSWDVLVPLFSRPNREIADRRMMFPRIHGSISFSKCFWEVIPSLGFRCNHGVVESHGRFLLFVQPPKITLRKRRKAKAK